MYDGIHVIAEVDSSGNLQKSYTYGPGIDNRLSYTDRTTTNTYYYLTDHLGTIHAVVDETGTNIVESYEYDAWGRVRAVYDSSGASLDESAIGNNYLWQGRWYSWKTGLYYFRARWYDPVTGRWLSKDPIGISGGLNQYVFCGNNPVNARDPLGLCEGKKSYLAQYRDFVKASFDFALGASIASATVAGGPFDPTEPIAQAGIWGTEGVVVVGAVVTMVAYPYARDLARETALSIAKTARDVYDKAKQRLKRWRKKPPWGDKRQPPRDPVRPKPTLPPAPGTPWDFPPDSGGPQY